MLKKNTRYTTGEKALTQGEWRLLQAQVNNLEDEVMLKLAISTGIRREDLGHSPKYNTGIRVSDIEEICDEKGNTIGGKLSFFEHKKNRIWEVPLSQEMMRKIRQLVNSRENKKEKFLITYSGRTCHRRLNDYCVAAGIEERPFHALRATCVKFCKDAKWSVEEVAKLTGDTIAVIQEHYSTPSKDEMKEIVNKKPIL